MSDNITDENFDKIHEAIDTTITTLEDSGSELGDIALCMFVEGANILEQMGLSKEEVSAMALDFLSSDEATVEMPSGLWPRRMLSMWWLGLRPQSAQSSQLWL